MPPRSRDELFDGGPERVRSLPGHRQGGIIGARTGRPEAGPELGPVEGDTEEAIKTLGELSNSKDPWTSKRESYANGLEFMENRSKFMNSIPYFQWKPMEIYGFH